MQIDHIDQLLPLIDGRKEFFVAERGRYKIIDYQILRPETFDHPGLLECRGIKFDADGNLLARPFQKFFNLGERPEGMPQDLDWSRPHRVLEKLDGTMIHPARLEGDIVFMTRMGTTRQAETALEFAKAALTAAQWQMIEDLMDQGITPVFEFTGPDNRIVVAYEEPHLTLLGARRNLCGQHMDWAELQAIAAKHDFPIVGGPDQPVTDWKGFVDQARDMVGQEGYVIRFEDGFMLKIKGTDYALKHKTLSYFGSEKNILQLVLDGGTDDIRPLLSEARANRLEAYERDLLQVLARHIEAIEQLAAKARDQGLDRKTVALTLAPTLPPALQGPFFAVMDGKPAAPAVTQALRTIAHSQPRIDKSRDLLGGITWQPERLEA